MNLVMLKGRMTKDIELKTMSNGKNLGNFSIAVQRSYKNANGEYESDFFNCTAFGASADFISKYFGKGQEILITGRLQNRSWEADDGTKRHATDVIVEKVEFCGSKNKTNDAGEKMVNDFNNAMANGTLDTKVDDLPF